MDLSAAIDKVATLAKGAVARISHVDFDDGRYVIDQQAGTVTRITEKPRVNIVKGLTSIDALIEWCKQIGSTKAGYGDVVISSDNTKNSYARFPSCALESERSFASVVFFQAFVPKNPMGLVEFLAWLDSIYNGMSNETRTEVDKACAYITTSSVQNLEIAQTGAVMTVRNTKENRPNLNMPKRITARLPFGDAAFVTPMTFALTITVSDKGVFSAVAELVEFELTDDGSVTGPRIRFVEWAKARLKAALEGAVTVGDDAVTVADGGVVWSIMS